MCCCSSSQLDKVHIEKAPTTVSGGIHLSPLKDQADFPANEVGARSAHGAALEQARTTTSHVSAPTTTSMIGSKARGGNDITESSHSGEVSVQSSVVMDTTQETNLQVRTQTGRQTVAQRERSARVRPTSEYRLCHS